MSPTRTAVAEVLLTTRWFRNTMIFFLLLFLFSLRPRRIGLDKQIGGVFGGSMEGISYRLGPSNTDGLQGVLGRGEHTAHLATLAGEELAFFASFFTVVLFYLPSLSPTYRLLFLAFSFSGWRFVSTAE